MAKLINADKLLKHLADEVKECEGSLVLTNDPYMRGVTQGTRLGLRSAISFVATLGDIQAMNEEGCKETNRDWLQSLTDTDLADFYTVGLIVVPFALPGVTQAINIREIASRYIDSRLGITDWLSESREFMTVKEWRARPFNETFNT